MSTEKRYRINEQIRVPQVRVISDTGEQLGVISRDEAMREATESGLDLVEVSPNEDPPVCRIMDYGKFKFQLNKKTVAAKKKQKQIQIKELKFRPTIEESDYQVKLRKIKEFIDGGDKVKLTVRFRGREMTHKEIGYKILEKLQADVAEYADVEQTGKFEGRQLMMVIASKKKDKEKV